MRKLHFPVIMGNLFVLLLFSMRLNAQEQTITGLVKDLDKKDALGLCNIFVLNTSLATTADENGRFKLSIPQTSAVTRLIIRYSGYLPDTVELSSEKKHYDIFLKQAQNALNEVVVTGFSRATTLREDPTAIKIISHRAIEQTAESNIIDVLAKNVPGLTAVKTGPNVSKPFIRGLGYNRVEVLYDGVPQQGQQFEDEEVLAVDMYEVEKAEVLLGPSTLLYGPDAMAGLVNLIPSAPGNTNKMLQGKFLSEYQSNNGLIGNSLRLNYGSDKWAYAVRGSYRLAQDYQNSIDGRVYNTGFKEIDASGTIAYKSHNGFTNLSASLYDNSQEIPEGARDSLTRKFTKIIYEDPDDDPETRPIVSGNELTSYKISSLYQHIQHYRVYSKSQYDFKNGSNLYAMVSFQQNLRKEYDYPIHTSTLGVSMRLNSYNYDFRYQLPRFANLETIIGANGLYQTNTNVNSTDIPIPDYHKFGLGSFVFAKWKKGSYTVTGGFRYDLSNISGKDFYTREDDQEFTRHVQVPDTVGADLLFPAFRNKYHGVSGNLGATYQLSNHLSIKANISKGTRMPHPAEFASNGLDGSAHSYFIGKNDLTPESNWQEDLGINVFSKDIDASLTFFNNNVKNYIYMVQLLDENGDPLELIPGNKTFQYHQSAAHLYGMEVSANLHPAAWKGFQFINNFAIINGLNVDKDYKGKGVDGEYLPMISPVKLLSSIVQDIKTTSHLFPLLSFRAEADINGAQNHYLATDETETATPGYTLFNAGVNVSVGYTKHTALQFQLLVNNIFDKAYQSNLSRLKYLEDFSESPNGHLGIYSMGRNICAKLILPF